MDDGFVVVVGGDPLALRVCSELAPRRRVAVLWDRDAEFEARVASSGASFVPRSGDERDSLLAAGIGDASVIIALTEDDHKNLQFVLTARDLNPGIRVVLRQFNRTLGRKIEQNLDDTSVISLSAASAATYAAAALDPTCYYGIQFPDIDGPLAGFFRTDAAAAGVSGCTAADAQARLAARLIAVDGETAFDATKPLEPGNQLILFGRVRMRGGGAAGASAMPRGRRVRRALQAIAHLDSVVRSAAVVAALVVVAGALFFAHALHLGPLSATYFVVTTMTTTGYGDISPQAAGGPGLVAAMILMIAGITFSGIFIAFLSSAFTQARYDAVQGLRPIRHGGHIIVCGAGNVGSRVIDFLVRLGCRIVVVEQSPRPEIVEGSRGRRYELLTGDATKDATLDLCNIEAAVALVALTHSDTMNLEVALGARARNGTLPIVMRVQLETFERSVRAHFDIEHTYGTAAIAAPILAGLAIAPGVRGRVEIGRRAYGIVEVRPQEKRAAFPAPDCVALAVARADSFALLSTLEDAEPHERVLLLAPIPQGGAAPAAQAEGA
jgi:Trk K+ transport system NAD-binding subunit